MSRGFDPSHKVEIEIYAIHSMVDAIYKYEQEIMRLKQENEKLRATTKTNDKPSDILSHGKDILKTLVTARTFCEDGSCGLCGEAIDAAISQCKESIEVQHEA